jgi:transcriptional regulator with XRE-family HTH domain
VHYRHALYMASADIRKQFGARVRKLRLERGWSQETLGFRAKIHRTYIGAVERGEQNVALDNIVKIAGALKISLANLFSIFR